MKKKSICGSLLALSLMLSATTTFAATGIKVNIDGIPLKMDQAPIIDNNRTLVPLRAIFEGLGAKVTWDQKTQTAVGVKGDKTVKVSIGNKAASVNGQKVYMDVPPKVVNNRTLVPVRFISEGLGASVLWDQTNFTVSISSNTVPNLMEPTVPTTPTLPTPPVTNLPSDPASGQKSNNLVGTWKGDGLNGASFYLAIHNDGTLDVIDLTTNTKGKGSYTLNNLTFTVTTPLASMQGSYSFEQFGQGFLLKDLSESGKNTKGITPMNYSDFTTKWSQIP